MVPIKGEWTSFVDINDQLNHYRLWGLIPPKSNKLRPIMIVDGYFDAPEPCNVVGYQGDNWAVIELADCFYAIHGEYLAELQPVANQKLPFGMCFVDILSKYVVLDIETTGFDFCNDRIIEIAAIAYQYGKKVSEFHTLVNPERLLPSDIISLTGITQEQIDNAPALDAVESSFLSFIGDSPLIGHNALSFDVPFLSAQMSRPFENPVIDTLPMARKVFDLLPRHKLEYLNEVLQLGSAGSHRAFNDVETTNALLWACLAPRKYEHHVYKAFLDHRLSQDKKDAKEKRVRKWKSSADQVPEAPKRKKHFERVDIKAITPSVTCNVQDGPLCGRTVVFTGELTIPREEAMQMAVNAGAVLKTSVSRKTAYLVVGKQDLTLVGMDGMSTKEVKARELNESGKAQIKIIDEKDFFKILNKEGAAV